MEPSFQAYAKSVAVNGYQATEHRAVELFQNPKFVSDVNQTLKNQFFDTKKNVDPLTEKAVKEEMVRSLEKALNTKEETTMNADYKPVTVEQYNNSLRDAVNAYYVHAMSDPSISKEEAIATTAQMSEQYLEAVEDFQSAQSQAVQTEASMGTTETLDTVEMSEPSVGGISNDGSSVDTGALVEDDGLDGGEDCDDGLDT